MPIYLDRIDSAPLETDDFSAEFEQWFSVAIDSLNEDLQRIENGFNTQLIAPSYTTVQITALAVSAPNGSFWYDTTTNQIKAKANNIVVVVV